LLLYLSLLVDGLHSKTTSPSSMWAGDSLLSPFTGEGGEQAGAVSISGAVRSKPLLDVIEGLHQSPWSEASSESVGAKHGDCPGVATIAAAGCGPGPLLPGVIRVLCCCLGGAVAVLCRSGAGGSGKPIAPHILGGFEGVSDGCRV